MIQVLVKKLSGSSFSARFFRSSAWLAAGNILEKILAFVSKIILARLLMPEELGVIVLITSITGLFECLTEVGVKQCVIQSRNGDKREFLDVVWWFSAIRGVILFSIAWMISPWVCRFYFEGKLQVLARYDWPVLYAMVQVAFLCVLFNGFISPKAHLLERKFSFGKVIAYMQSAALAGTILTIVLSFMLRNAWAMVLGFVFQIFLRMVMSYVFCPFMPRLFFHSESWREILRFARGMWGAPFFAYIAYNIDVLVGGKIVGPELIGFYGFAKGLAYIPRDLFGRIINPVLMPAFVEKAGYDSKLRQIVGQIVKMLIVVGLPVIVVCFIFQKPIITTVYGKNFQSVALVFAIMAINSLWIMTNLVFVNVCFALGKPEINRNCTFIRAVILISLIVPAAKIFDLEGMATMQVLANFITVVVFVACLKGLIGIRVSDLFPVCLKLNR